jgi:transposase InsO family protein
LRAHPCAKPPFDQCRASRFECGLGFGNTAMPLQAIPAAARPAMFGLVDCEASTVRLRNPPEGCIFHSDRGSQYCAYDYQKKLQAYGLRPSMSGKGNCYDTASVETFFKTIKAELIWRQSWPTRRQAEAAIFGYINGFYNARRRHSYLGGISPLAFEAKVA